MKYVVFGDLLPKYELIDQRTAALVVWIARHSRRSRVKRHGRRGQRGWTLTPRNKSEHFKPKGRLKK